MERVLARGFVIAASLASCRGVPASAPPISTDRPGFLFASSVVPRGVAQLEVSSPGVAWNPGGGDDDLAASIYPQLRCGWTDEVELRLAATALAHARTESGPGTSTDTGVGDVELGLKWALPTDTPAALVGTVRLPTGDDPFTHDREAYSLFAIAERPIDERHWVKGMAGWMRAPDGGGAELESGAVAALLGRSFTSRLGGNVEAACFPALESGPDPAFAGVCAYCLLGRDAQIDVSLHRGLNDDSADWLLALGWAVRW